MTEHLSKWEGWQEESLRRFRSSQSTLGMVWRGRQHSPGSRALGSAHWLCFVGNGCAAPTLVAGQGVLGEVLGKVGISPL